MILLSGLNTQSLTGKVASLMNKKISIVEYSKFPDEEQYIRINENIENENVLIIHNIINSSDFISLLQLINACDTAKKISLVIPYMGYSRQDQRFLKGEAISSKIIAQSINCDIVYTINIHKKKILDYFNCKSINLDATYLLSEYIKNMNINNPYLIAPDSGASEMIENISKDLKCDYTIFNKKRINGYNVKINNKNIDIDINNKSILLIDDIISTGNTMIESINFISKYNIKDISCFCIHPIFSKDSILRLYNSGIKNIIATDTIEKIQSKISVSSLIAKNIYSNIK